MNRILNYFPNLDKSAIIRLEKLMPLYMEWNQKINVVSRKDISELYLHHVLHSLSIIKTGLIKPGETVLDVGCGGGFPVIPLAILMQNVHFTALDSIGKKIKVVNEVIRTLELDNVTTINDRVENIANSYDWVISRAVTALPQFVTWTWDKTRNGILYLKGGDLSSEISDCKRTVKEFNISEWFTEEFFQTKKILYLPKKVK